MEDEYIPIKKDFVDIYGIKWWPTQVDNYNKIGKQIHDRRKNGYHVSQELLNISHRQYLIPFEMKIVKHVKVIFENGKSLITRINGTEKEVENYYLNNYFNMNVYTDNSIEEPLTKGKQVIFLNG